MSAREQQLATARVLMRLLAEDLPLVSWTLPSYGGARVRGQIGTDQGSVQERLASLQTWADRLGAQLDVTRYAKQTGGNVNVSGEIDGVSIDVFSPFLKKDLPKSSAPARPSVRGGPDIGPDAEAGYRAEQDDQP